MKRTIPLGKLANHGLLISVSTLFAFSGSTLCYHEADTSETVVHAAVQNPRQALQNAINAGKQYTRKYYTAVTFNRLQQALTQAELTNRNLRSTPEQLKTALLNVDNAIANISRIPVAPIAPSIKSNLQNALARAQAFTPKYYTVTSYGRLKQAINDAQAVLYFWPATASQYVVYTNALNTAMNDIQRIPVAPVPTVLKNALQQAINAGSAYTPPYYTVVSFARLQTALNFARSILTFWPATASQYQSALASLNTAMQTIDRLPANKTNLVATINATKQFTLAFYTNTSVANLQTALNNAIQINNKPNVQMWQVLQATSQLQTAMQQMTRQPRSRTELTSLLQQATQVVKFPGAWKVKATDKFGTWYTQASVRAVANQLPMAMQAYTNHQASVADVTNAYIWLTKTLANLQPIAGPFIIEQPAPVTMSLLTFKNNPTIFMLPVMNGRNGQVQAGDINWHVNVTTTIKGQQYNLITNLTNALKVMTPGQYTLTYTVNGGTGNTPVTNTVTRVLNLTADGQNNFNNPTYHFGLAPMTTISRDPNMYSTLPYAELSANPALYDNNNALVDPQAYRVNYQIMLGQQAYGLFDMAVDYALPGSYRINFAATGVYTGRALTNFTQTMNLNTTDNRNVIKPNANYQFIGLTPATISGSDYQAILNSGDNGDASFDPFYGVGLVDSRQQAVTNYGTVNVYSDWAKLDFGQGNYANPGQYQVQYYAIAADGHMVATGTRSITITK